MKRSGFTMIELVFVIVILGILASVAIPKLAATRDDAKIAAIAQQVQGAIAEIPAYITAKGKTDTFVEMSQVFSQMDKQGKLTVSNSGKTIVLQTLDDSATLDDCFQFDVNNTVFKVKHMANTNNKVCTGVQARIAEGNFTIGGTSVVF